MAWFVLCFSFPYSMKFVAIKKELEKKNKMSEFGLVVEGISKGLWLLAFGVGWQFLFSKFYCLGGV